MIRQPSQPAISRITAWVTLMLTCAALLSQVAVAAASQDRMQIKRAPPSSRASASASASSSAASSAPTKSSSSYISVSLPDSFIQCRPATVNFTSVLGTQDRTLLGDSLLEAQEYTWLTIVIRDDAGKGQHYNTTLSATDTSWTWPKVDLPAGSSFSFVMSAYANRTLPDSVTSSAKSSASSSSAKSSGSDREKGRRGLVDDNDNNDAGSLVQREASSPSETASSGSIRSTYRSGPKKGTSRNSGPLVLAHSYSRSQVIAGPDNDTSCLLPDALGTDRNPGPENANGDEGEYGSPHRPHRSSSGGDHTTKIVAGLLGSIVGVFATILAILAWQRSKDSKRSRRLLAEGRSEWDDGSADRVHHIQHGHNGIDSSGTVAAGTRSMGQVNHQYRRSVPVAAWDGGYQNSPSAGWTYMSSLAPGLNPGQPPEFGSRGRPGGNSPTSPVGPDGQPHSATGSSGFPLFRNRRRQSAFNFPVNRRREEEEEEDLPSYLTSQEEIKGLPRYDPSVDGGAGLRRHLQEIRAAGHVPSEEMMEMMASQEEQERAQRQEMSFAPSGVSSSINTSSLATAATIDAGNGNPPHGAGPTTAPRRSRLGSMGTEDDDHPDEESNLLASASTASSAMANRSGGDGNNHDSSSARAEPALRYLPSGPDRPYSSLETDPVPRVTRSDSGVSTPPRAEISTSSTLNSIDRQQRQRTSSGENSLRINTNVSQGPESTRSPFDDPDDQPTPISRLINNSNRNDDINGDRPNYWSGGSDWSQSSG
ncbi:unnamed protein product [Sympodiomycopsis kandeliae]